MEIFDQLSEYWLQMDRSERWSVVSALYAASIAILVWISYDFVGKDFIVWVRRKGRSLLIIATIVGYSLVYWNVALPMLGVTGSSEAAEPAPSRVQPAPAPMPARSVQPPAPPIALPETRPDVRSCTVDDPTGTALNLRVRPRDTVLTTIENGEKVEMNRTVEYNGRTWASVYYPLESTRGWVLYDYLNCER